MNDSPGPARPLLLVRVVRAAVRLTLVVGILLAGILLMQTWHLLFHEPPTLPIRTEAATGFGGLPDGVFAEGSWQLGDNDWSFQMSQAAPDSPEPKIDPLRRGIVESASDLDRTILDWLRSANALSEPTAPGLRQYRLELGGSRLRLLTRGEAREEAIVWARLDQNIGERVSRMEFRRTPKTDSTQPPLLELPAGVRTLATRIGDDRRVQAQLLGPVASLSDMQKHWSGLGWEIESPFAADGGAIGFRLRRGEEVVDVWRYRGTEAMSKEYLLTVRGR